MSYFLGLGQRALQLTATFRLAPPLFPLLIPASRSHYLTYHTYLSSFEISYSPPSGKGTATKAQPTTKHLYRRLRREESKTASSSLTAMATSHWKLAKTGSPIWCHRGPWQTHLPSLTPYSSVDISSQGRPRAVGLFSCPKMTWKASRLSSTSYTISGKNSPQHFIIFGPTGPRERTGRASCVSSSVWLSLQTSTTSSTCCNQWPIHGSVTSTGAVWTRTRRQGIVLAFSGLAGSSETSK